MFYFVKTPRWIKWLYTTCIWKIPNTGNVLYLTFDDGPHPIVTNFVLDELKKYNAKATFFCIGKNVKNYPDVYKRIVAEGHGVGNHTQDHLNGWKTTTDNYLNNIREAKKYIASSLFRPPYGRIRSAQIKALQQSEQAFKIVMWTVLSGDFDRALSVEKCCSNVINNSSAGSIIVFHDSEKAVEKISYALPIVLKYFTEKGYVFEKIEQGRNEG